MPAIVVAFGALPYLLMAGWLQNAHEHSGLISRQSVWNAIGSFVSNGDLLHSLASNGATIVAGALLLVIAVRHTSREPRARDRGRPRVVPRRELVGHAVVRVHGAPAARAAPPNLLSWTVALYSSLVLLGEQYPSLSADTIGSAGHIFLQNLLPVAALVCCVIVVVFRPRDVLAGDLGETAVDTTVTAAPRLAASA